MERLNPNSIAEAISLGLRYGCDFAEVFIEHSEIRSWDWHGWSSKLEPCNESHAGLSVTLEYNGRAARAACAVITPDSLKWTLHQAVKKLLGPSAAPIRDQTVALWDCAEFINKYSELNHPNLGLDFDTAGKAMRRLAKAVKSHSGYEPWAQFWSKLQTMEVYSSTGVSEWDIRSPGHVFLEICDRATGEQTVERGIAWSGPLPQDFFSRVERLGTECLNVLSQAPYRRACPAYSGQVLMGRRMGGVMFHEAVGHLVEFDGLGRDDTAYLQHLGRQAAAEFVSVIDDPTLDGGYGSYAFDDEGARARKTFLVKNGMLAGILTNRTSARDFDLKRTGSARRGSFHLPPLTRMSNTYLKAGGYSFDDLLAFLRTGLYVHKAGEACIDWPSGEMLVEVREGFWCSDGKISYPVLPCTLMVNPQSLLSGIKAVGADFSMDGSWCDKHGSTVQVGIGQPSFIAAGIRVEPRSYFEIINYPIAGQRCTGVNYKAHSACCGVLYPRRINLKN